MRAFDAILQEFGGGFRALRRRPGFAIAAVTILALGIGANTAIFTLINAVLLAPLPYPHADRIVQLWLSDRRAGGGGLVLSVPEINLLAQQTALFQAFAAYDFGGPGVNVTGSGEPEQVKAIHVSRDYFRLFGAGFEIGRPFTADEDRPNGGRFVVISHALWDRRFGANPGLVGKTISLGSEPYLVTGVLARDFHPDPPAEVWLPVQADLNSTGQAHYVRAAARLQDGISLEQANARLEATTAEFLRRFPLFNPNAYFEAKPLRETNAHDVRTALLVLFGAVVLVLLIACSNVSSLLLARGVARRREIAIRGAVGASRARIMTQLLMESLLLSVAGALLGFGLGAFSVRTMLDFYPEALSGRNSVSPDWRVFAFAAVTALLATVAFGLLPALRNSRVSLVEAMLEGDARSGSGPATVMTKSVLVVFQVALSVLLLTGAGLMIRTFAALRQAQPGLDPHYVLTMEMSIQGTRYKDTSSVARLAENGVTRLKQVPGVIAAATSWTLPVENAFSSTLVIEGRPLGNSVVHGGILMRPVSPEFSDVFRIPILRGRFFNDRDTSASVSVAVISQAAAKKYWPVGNPIGEQITTDKYLGPDFAAPPREIVGVAGDVRDLAMDKEPMPIVYIPQSQVPNGMTRIDASILPITWSIRTAVAPHSLLVHVQRALRDASGGLAVARIRSMREVLAKSTVRSDFTGVLLTAFAALSLSLAGAGLYGLITFSVRQRRREIGIRVALGATSDRVIRMIVWQGFRLVIAGIVIGAGMSVGLARFTQSLIYGVKPIDPLVIFGSIATLSIVAALACFVPAFRASRVDPATELRAA
jgi:predicted permease